MLKSRIEARRVIEQHQTLKLSLEDSNAFVEAILNPLQPNEALKPTALQYKK
ncbi:type II toxin-antitoxin system TacA family antitoxin [Egbenema bharatensis]|uniref:type II toxin-antitoxin system TacA family antitoxin n=1 Tax=Egbenema bharatensis TaxID=3463334 RepID=UPI003A8BE87D